MFRTNVDGTTIVLDAASRPGRRASSTSPPWGCFGNTRGKVVDESYERPDRDFLSYYDATKYMAHRVAVARQAAGAPLVDRAARRRLRPRRPQRAGAPRSTRRRGASTTIRAFPELGFTMGYLDDVADGVVLAQTEGAPGEPTCSAER